MKAPTHSPHVPPCGPSRQVILERRSVLRLGSAASLLGALGLVGCSPPAMGRQSSVARRGKTEVPSRGSAASSAAAVQGKLLRLPASSRDHMVAVVMLSLNTPYKYGGTSPKEGFDCSGLVFYALGQAGHQGLPRSSSQWATRSVVIPPNRLRRGDFVFFNTMGARYSHMGIYVGDGEFVHAPASGKVVSKASLSSGYFQRNFIEARTVFA